MKKVFLISSILLTILTACNKDWEFEDYKYSTVYFPYQTPVRTLVLGEDLFDNTLDNQHKFQIMAAMGGVYENTKDITLDVVVDNSLANNLRFGSANGDSVLAMPNNYYSLPGKSQIVIPTGKMMGGIEIQLTDAFFADPRSIKNTYVIPMRIASVNNVDSILSGKGNVATPDRRKATDWAVAPKDYVLYAVKYVNPWHGFYLRRGVDMVKGANGNTAEDTTLVYRKDYVVKDEVVKVVTQSLTGATLDLNAKSKANVNMPFQLELKFDDKGKVTINNPATAMYTASGNGEFVKQGDMWGNEKRDVLHLNYEVNFGDAVHQFKDTIVLRDRGVKMETFTPVIVQ